ncbi:MAG: hypothetical protein WAZ99_06360 [Rectinemataceae bacterium]
MTVLLQHNLRPPEGGKFLAVAISPPGNVARILREAKTGAFRAGGSPEALSFPEALFLAFFAFPAKMELRILRKCFAGSAARIFDALPARLVSDDLHGLHGLHECDGFLYAKPGGTYDARSAAKAALAFGAECALVPLDSPPLEPAEGFLCCKGVSCDGVPAFSFGHMDAVLYSFGAGKDPLTALSWVELARVPRRTGPRKPVSPS